jgi:hypothetical protein
MRWQWQRLKRDDDDDGRHNGSATAILAMDNATAMGDKEEKRPGEGAH